MKIITNNHWRNFIYGFELPTEALAEFSELEDIENQTFIKYKGEYMLVEFSDIPQRMREEVHEFKDWDAYMSDSFFSGLLIKFSEDCQEYQIATYID